MEKLKRIVAGIATTFVAGSILISGKAVAADYSAINSVSGNHLENGNGMPEETEEEKGRKDEREQEEGIESRTAETVEQEETAEREGPVMSLRVPRELEVIIDPWEQAGRGQIYSENYQIQNSGEEAGTLLLSCFVEKGGTQKQLKILNSSDKIHENNLNAVYIEILFDDGTRMVLGEDGGRYEAELGAEGHISFQFTGEVNENASEDWEDGDIKITIVCGWKPGEKETDTVETQMSEAKAEETESVTETETETETEPETEEMDSTMETESETEGTESIAETESETEETENITETESTLEFKGSETEGETETIGNTETESGQELSSSAESEEEKKTAEAAMPEEGQNSTEEGQETGAGA